MAAIDSLSIVARPRNIPSAQATASGRFEKGEQLNIRAMVVGILVVEEVTTPRLGLSAARTRNLVHYEVNVPNS